METTPYTLNIIVTEDLPIQAIYISGAMILT